MQRDGNLALMLYQNSYIVVLTLKQRSKSSICTKSTNTFLHSYLNLCVVSQLASFFQIMFNKMLN